MRSADNIEKYIQNAKIKTNPKVNEAVLTQLFDQMDNAAGTSIALQQRRRFIMASRLIKFSAAAAILIAAVITLTILNGTEAYAIGQTIEALSKISTVHIIGTDWDGNRFETWIKTNPENGNSDYVCIDQTPHEFKISSTPGGTCIWDKDGNVKRKTNRIMATFDARFEYMFQDMLEQIESGSIKEDESVRIYNEHDIETGQDVIVIWSVSKMQDSKTYIDPQTKLPVRMSFDRAPNPQILKTADQITYNEPIPQGLFDFQITAGDTEPDYAPLYDRKNGMDATGLTQEQACTQATRQYWQAVIDGDWDYVQKLRPICNAEFWKNAYSDNQPSEIIKIGNPFTKRGCNGTLVPCIIKHTDGRIFEVTLVVQYNEVDGYSFCTIPATWGQNTEIK